jgi:hypothetical protein
MTQPKKSYVNSIEFEYQLFIHAIWENYPRNHISNPFWIQRNLLPKVQIVYLWFVITLPWPLDIVNKQLKETFTMLHTSQPKVRDLPSFSSMIIRDMSSGALEIENSKVLDSWKTIIATSRWTTFNIHLPGFSYSLPNRFCCQKKKIMIASAKSCQSWSSCTHLCITYT